MVPETDFSTFCRLARQGRIVPVAREFSADTLTPVTAYAAIARPPFSFLLESLVGGERWARYTFMGTEPLEAWRFSKGMAERWTPERGWSEPRSAADVLGFVADRIRPLKASELAGLPRFTGGMVGYVGYDVVRTLERLPPGPADDLGLPDAVFMLVDSLVVIDNAFGRAIVIANVEIPPDAQEEQLRVLYAAAETRIDELFARLRNPPRLDPLNLRPKGELQRSSPYRRAAFERDVERLKEYIKAGDIFQAVLSRRQEVSCSAPPLAVYRALRALNPAPYLYLLELDGLAIAGSSPEVLVRVEDGEITVRPIAGTRPRGASREEDEQLAAELLADEKEQAEHLMLVDLGRNDVGRVAEYGSVRVTDYKVIERYSHVQHIVSEVRGRLRAGLDALDVLKACFPAGTVTGAPKIRAMELIDQMEPTRRGPYAGAVGYVGWGAAALDTAIAIRTAVLTPGKAYVQAGAGIVADSDPGREYQETENKAQAVLAALALAESSGNLGAG
ncbi:MAG: anthranilate synthase component I [Gemmatimonadales bacterium]|nr:Anthranilate synthase component 1 [bacterium HR33]GIW52519.1 MAG: anthranilate synthase component I [Gemmatimonadales bacterium]